MIKKFTHNQIKNINKITWIACGLCVIFFIILISIINYNENNLLKNGIREEVVIVQKIKSGYNVKFSNIHYYLVVDWFEEEEEIISSQKPKDTIGLSNLEKMSILILQKTFKKKVIRKIKRLNKEVKLNYVSGTTFSRLHVGEIITLVYFKEKPKEARLLREIVK
jgi:hypothetical protein